MSIKEEWRRLISDAKKVWNAPGGKRPFSARYRSYEKPETAPDEPHNEKHPAHKDRKQS
jgi:hypothetical protein